MCDLRRMVKYTSEIGTHLKQNMMLEVASGLASAAVCNHFAVPLIVTWATSVLVVPLMVTAAVISLGSSFHTTPFLYANATALTMLAVATFFQRPLPFLSTNQSWIYWAIPRVIVLKIGYNLFCKFEKLEFRPKANEPPPYRT